MLVAVVVFMGVVMVGVKIILVVVPIAAVMVKVTTVGMVMLVAQSRGRFNNHSS